MATLGAVIGGYITYRLARKGGKEAMERKLSRKRDLLRDADAVIGEIAVVQWRYRMSDAKI